MSSLSILLTRKWLIIEFFDTCNSDIVIHTNDYRYQNI